MSTLTDRRAAPDVPGSMVRAGGLATLAAIGVGGVAGGIFLGRPDLWPAVACAAIGAGLAGLTMTTGAQAVGWLLRQMEGSMVLVGAFMIAVAQLALLLAVVLLLRQLSWWDDAAMAVGALVGVVGVQIALVVTSLRGRPELEVEPW